MQHNSRTTTSPQKRFSVLGVIGMAVFMQPVRSFVATASQLASIPWIFWAESLRWYAL